MSTGQAESVATAIKLTEPKPCKCGHAAHEHYNATTKLSTSKFKGTYCGKFLCPCAKYQPTKVKP